MLNTILLVITVLLLTRLVYLLGEIVEAQRDVLPQVKEALESLQPLPARSFVEDMAGLPDPQRSIFDQLGRLVWDMHLDLRDRLERIEKGMNIRGSGDQR